MEAARCVAILGEIAKLDSHFCQGFSPNFQPNLVDPFFFPRFFWGTSRVLLPGRIQTSPGVQEVGNSPTVTWIIIEIEALHLSILVLFNGCSFLILVAVCEKSDFSISLKR